MRGVDKSLFTFTLDSITKTMSTNKQKKSDIIACIDHARFLEMLAQEFPNVVQAIDKYRKGLLHCEMGVLARLTEEAMDERQFEQVVRYMNFIDRVREGATPEVENAVDVSFIEYLAFSEFTENRYEAMRRMPHVLRTILLRIDGRGRWV